jgi:O-antigen/teichoic acid export membrane protein
MTQTGGLVALAGRLERRPGLLGAAKLANVVLAMAWGFVVTFVFVRLLPLDEFRAFLLFIAFANFTVSAELGLTSIAYSRLRRDRIAGEGAFRNEEIVALLWLMSGLILLGACLLGVAIATGLLPTRHPLLFVAFYGVSAINLLAVLTRRVLAALDHNLWWEALDLVRRVTGIGLLLAALVGLPILDSVLLQLAVAVLMLWLGLNTVHRSLAMTGARWLGVRTGAAHVRTHYLADFGRTGALTLFDVTAYNAPYLTIAAATSDVRPLLLFDFAFKISRALSAVIRALVETMLPALTRAHFAKDTATFRASLVGCLRWTLGLTLVAALAVMIAGQPLAHIIFDGNITLNIIELLCIMLLLVGLGVICVSVYVQNGLGRFGALVGPSFLFLLGSLLSVPLALWLLPTSLSLAFIALYAAVHMALALIHGRLLTRLSHGSHA